MYACNTSMGACKYIFSYWMPSMLLLSWYVTNMLSMQLFLLPLCTGTNTIVSVELNLCMECLLMHACRYVGIHIRIIMFILMSYFNYYYNNLCLHSDKKLICRFFNLPNIKCALHNNLERKIDSESKHINNNTTKNNFTIIIGLMLLLPLQIIFISPLIFHSCHTLLLMTYIIWLHFLAFQMRGLSSQHRQISSSCKLWTQ